jgi:hypothetical protein
MKFIIRVSDAPYKITFDKLLYGIGQGSCSSPIIWAVLNQLLLMALGQAFDCISCVPVDGKTTIICPCDWLMDDMTTGAIDDNHHLEPILSSASELNQEEEGLVARMEEIIQFVLDLLQVTDGDLALEKGEWYLIGHLCSKGFPTLIQI